PDGTYSGVIQTLPDRGPNNVAGLATTNYAARLETFAVTLNGASLTLKPSGGTLLKDSTGSAFTGRDPGKGSLTRDGMLYPSPPHGDAGADRISIDPEAVSFLADGSFYVGDEYGPMIYHFGADGRQQGAIMPTPAIAPKISAQPGFGSNDNPVQPGSTGRRSNQGLEGVSVSPDGRRLFAVLQSATLQDNPANADVQRNTTRVLVYDITRTKTPSQPVGEYVLQLPTYRANGDGGPADRTAAQSEILALNERQFLMLSRDGAGRGSGSSRPPVFKSVMLVDLVGASNLAGTPYEFDTDSVVGGANASGATLKPNIIPVQIEELVNLLHPAELAKFGIDLKTAPSDARSLSEKWESMAVAPAMDPANPDDFFLFIGNDNDFRSSRLEVAGVKGVSTALTDPASGTGDVDNMVLVYRVSLPTWETEPPKPPAAVKKAPSKKSKKKAAPSKRRRGRH
ncbi:MAG TPA: esterase-like activity of phytase family protein, partial [Caulobacteraceae bacterium]|nr:esterase-like activity of phytase family protein [Caulobacteraceae bacterium]